MSFTPTSPACRSTCRRVWVIWGMNGRRGVWTIWGMTGGVGADLP